MFGLLQTIGGELECMAYSIANVTEKAKYNIASKAIDAKHEIVSKCQRRANEKAKNTSKSNDILENIFDFDIDNDVEKFKTYSNECFENFKEQLAKATPEQLSELSKSAEIFDLLGGFMFSVRAEIGKATNQKTPVLLPQTGTIPLHEQAAQKGGVTGKDIVDNLRNQQDIQHANPQGINNPIPGKA